MKRIVIGFIFALLMFSTTVAFAAESAEEEMETQTTCVHEYVESYTVSYYSKNSTVHYCVKSNICTVCRKCGYVVSSIDAPITFEENHSYSGWTYTGTNYHSGSKHYFEEKGSCVCGATTTRTIAYDCPGNGVHIGYGLIDDKVEK